MEQLLGDLGTAFSFIMQPTSMIILGGGVILGLLTGAIPALGGIVGLAILLPFMFMMDPFLGIILFMGMMAATNTGDTIPAVLFGVPGSSSSQATILDGHPLAKKGEAARALSAAYLASMIGGILGAVLLTGTLEVIRPVILLFGSPELFALGLLGIAMTGALSVGAPLKGLIAGGLGLLVSSIGTDLLTASQRYTYGTPYLYDGVSVVLIALGIFALPEVINLMVQGKSISSTGTVEVAGSRLRGIKDTLRNWWLVVRTSIIGIVVGALPGLGGSVTDWFAYSHAAQTCKGAKETFGKGDIRGVIGVDAATNSKEGGGLIPTLAFGIPGSTSMAFLLSAFLMNGFPVGPRLLTEHTDLTLTIVWSLVIANIMATALMLLMVKQVAKIAIVPFHLLAPFLISLIVFAAYQSTIHRWDLYTLILLTFLGWNMKRFGWPRPPFVLAFVLGPIMERFFFNAMGRYGAGFVTRPIVMVILALIAFTVLSSVVRQAREGTRAAKARQTGSAAHSTEATE